MALRFALLTVLAVALAALVCGCPKQTNTETPKTDTSVQPAPPTSTGAEATKTEGTAGVGVETLLKDRCTQCHSIDRIEKEQAKADAEEWGKIIKRMQDHAVKKNKTPITDEEAKTIMDHLLATAPK
jgi:cytochrome c5